MDDAAAWHVLTPLLRPYLPWSSGAMRPAGLVRVLNEVWFRPAPFVLELGSGASTVVLARLLRELGGGALLAVEHDPRWADRIRQQLAREQLDAVASVALAPLDRSRQVWAGTPWYDEAVLAAARPGRQVDVLVVDGPPAWQPGTEHSRYPALAVLAGWLAPGAAIVLDDIERAGEQTVLDRWRVEHDLRFELDPQAGIAIGTWPEG